MQNLPPRNLLKNLVFVQYVVAILRMVIVSEYQQDAQKGQTSHPPNPGAPRRAVPRARPQRTIPFIWGGWDDPNCARPTRAFSSRALREQGDRPSYPTSFSSILQGIENSVT